LFRRRGFDLFKGGRGKDEETNHRKPYSKKKRKNPSSNSHLRWERKFYGEKGDENLEAGNPRGEEGRGVLTCSGEKSYVEKRRDNQQFFAISKKKKKKIKK